ncbi:MAG: hypothetical protein PHV82_04750 [Victivallaceae bacterium]|nr:hypothetical protein [Victivallaceae bacterium]
MTYNARKEFEKIEKDNAALLKLIADKLAERSAIYRGEGIHGGHVGTIMDIRHHLRETLAMMMFTANCKEEEVYAEIKRQIKKVKTNL